MTESVTQHYSWTKPEVTKSASTWGGFLNTDLDSIDALVYANQQGIVPIGSITMFAGATAPANWLICDGRSLDTTAYAALFAVLSYTHGGSGANFNLPNLSSSFPLGAGASNPVGQAGGSNSYTLDVAHLPPHAHVVEQTPHSHSATASASGGSHAHGISDVDPGHTHSVNVVFGGGSQIASGSGWGQHNVASGGSTTGISTTDTQTPVISVSVAVSAETANVNGNSTDSVGGGASMSIVPQYVALNFIIRAA